MNKIGRQERRSGAVSCSKCLSSKEETLDSNSSSASMNKTFNSYGSLTKMAWPLSSVTSSNPPVSHAILKLFLSCLLTPVDFQIISPPLAGLKSLENVSFTELEQCEACPGCRVAYFHSDPLTYTHSIHKCYVQNRLSRDAELRFSTNSRTPASDPDFTNYISYLVCLFGGTDKTQTPVTWQKVGLFLKCYELFWCVFYVTSCCQLSNKGGEDLQNIIHFLRLYTTITSCCILWYINIFWQKQQVEGVDLLSCFGGQRGTCTIFSRWL